ncbi:glycoside hydrolase family 125 protein [Kiritimatiellaeota bacterium B1221]|nr:glycoside hydrolase family 125 protein [Kiritimatiellaeota bacterium B1221]
MNKTFTSKRPQPADRAFHSEAVEQKIIEVQAAIADPELAWLFANCYPNTLDTTVRMGKNAGGETDTCIITGDINAMWLRDATNQVWPYIPLASEDPLLQDMLEGVIRRQADCIRVDPYANAFMPDLEDAPHWASDYTEMRAGVHERKFEMDSLCAFLRLSAGFYEVCPESTVFDERWMEALQLVIQTFRVEQGVEESPYRFAREFDRPTETLQDGVGFPVKPCGMVKSYFRPSDDATTFKFLVPANVMAVVNLREVASMPPAKEVAGDLLLLADEIDAALKSHGTMTHPSFGEIYAYEVDGFGSVWVMDDANVPSLLSLPYLGYCEMNDPLYQNTRRFLWSENNPYFVRGKAGEGIGGPHVGPDWLWPMSIMVKALTTDDKDEIFDCLRQLRNTHAETGFMHESFHMDHAGRFSRKWFAWANSLFGELIIKLYHQNPELLQKKF